MPCDINVMCCDSLNANIKKCNCFCMGQHTHKVIYTNEEKNITVLSVKKRYLKEFIDFDDILETDFYTFARDKTGDIRYVTAQGDNVIQSRARRGSDDGEGTTSDRSWSPGQSDELQGQVMNAVLSEYMFDFLHPIFEMVLAGVHHQLVVMWRSHTYLLRTYPIKDHKGKVTAGTIVWHPFRSAFNVDTGDHVLDTQKMT